MPFQPGFVGNLCFYISSLHVCFHWISYFPSLLLIYTLTKHYLIYSNVLISHILSSCPLQLHYVQQLPVFEGGQAVLYTFTAPEVEKFGWSELLHWNFCCSDWQSALGFLVIMSNLKAPCHAVTRVEMSIYRLTWGLYVKISVFWIVTGSLSVYCLRLCICFLHFHIRASLEKGLVSLS